jgi:cytochrome P450
MSITAVEELGAAPPWTSAGHRDPTRWYTAAHESHSPVVIDKRSGVLQIVGYEAVREFLLNAEGWSTAKRVEAVDPSLRIVRLLTSDPPIHLPLRGHFARAYRPKRMLDLQNRARTVCGELLDQCIARGAFDVVNDLMKPLAVIMVADIIGVPPESHAALLPLGTPVRLGAVDPTGTAKLTELLYAGAKSKQQQVANDLFLDLIEQRRRNPQDDLVSDLARIPPEDLPEKLDVSALLFEQFGAGTNTTVHAFGNAILMLHQHRDVLARVQADPTLVPTAIEEVVRLHSPLQARPRVATRDMVFRGEQVAEGTIALGWLAAANVDPGKFDSPLAFDVARTPNQHIAFGFGEHVCLGNALARLELRTALELWLARIGDFELADAVPAWTEDFILHGLEYLNVRVRPR